MHQTVVDAQFFKAKGYHVTPHLFSMPITHVEHGSGHDNAKYLIYFLSGDLEADK
jgi:hypothetical protein